MAFVVTLMCLGAKHRSCVEVCPVDCFYDIRDPELNKKYNRPPVGCEGEWDGSTEGYDSRDFGMLMIHPDECIHCGACVSECPENAIYEDTSVPPEYEEFIQLNADRTLNLSEEELDELRVTSKED